MSAEIELITDILKDTLDECTCWKIIDGAHGFLSHHPGCYAWLTHDTTGYIIGKYYIETETNIIMECIDYEDECFIFRPVLEER